MQKICTIIFLLLSSISFAQGSSLSLYDLKEAYLEKRDYYYKNGEKSITAEEQAELDKLVTILKENGAQSFDYHLIKYINSNYDLTQKDHLLEAYRLKPDDRRVNIEMFGYAMLTNNTSDQKKFALKVKAYTSEASWNYYSVLANKTGESVVFFSQAEDAYPAMAKQIIEKGKTTFISLDLLKNETYRKGVQKKLSMPNTAFVGNESEFLKVALKGSPTNCFIATTVPQRYMMGMGNQCYLMGLYYQYKPTDQYSVLQAFYAQIDKTLPLLSGYTNRDKKLYNNYLPPLLTLYKMKKLNGESDMELRKKIIELATGLNKTETVNKILAAYDKLE
jgi:hypothetical protein